MGGEIPTTSEGWVQDERVAIKMVDIVSAGAGGGSIAWVDSLGLPRVGPNSAGSDPGPACYAKGGENPTVTDAGPGARLHRPRILPGGRDRARRRTGRARYQAKGSGAARDDLRGRLPRR